MTVFVGCVCVAVSAWLTHRARAQVDEIMMGVGAQMMRYEGARRQDAPRPLVLNGARILMASGSTAHDVERVLDWFEARCQERDGRLAEQIRELAGANDIDDANPALLDATLRNDAGDRGYVACLDTGGERLDPTAIVERVNRYLESGDLADVGHLRYVFAERSERGAHFVAYWTEGALPVGEMFPETGDAPGVDPAGIPRPEGARRVLSAWEEAEAQSMTIWTDSAESPEELERFYRQRLPAEGWSLVEPEGGLPSTGEGRALVVDRDGSMATLVLSADPDGRGVVTVLVSR